MAITEHSNRSLFKPSDLEKQRQVLLADTIEVQKHIPAGILPLAPLPSETIVRSWISNMDTALNDLPQGLTLLPDGSVQFVPDPEPGPGDFADLADDEPRDESDDDADGDADDDFDEWEFDDGWDPGPTKTPIIDLLAGEHPDFRLVRIEPCTFLMGSPAREQWRHQDEIQHPVTLTRPFYIMTTTVTNRLWCAVWGTACQPEYPDGPRHPLTGANWWDVHEFIRQINLVCHPVVFRLPTEAEWECACRAGTTGPTYGGLFSTTCHWYNSYYRPQEVAKLQPNAWGLYDMLGNVHEWCQDFYGPYPDGPVTDPTGPTLAQAIERYGHLTDADGNPLSVRSFPRVARGGSAMGDRISCRAASRASYPADLGFNPLIGFRLVTDDGERQN